jgi:hypothetical protein
VDEQTPKPWKGSKSAFQDHTSQYAGVLFATTVQEAQAQHLHPAFPCEFWPLSNIFQKESRYFILLLQFSFLVGGGCAKSQILTRFSFFKYCFWAFYYYNILDTVQMNILDHLNHHNLPCIVCYNGFSGCSGCAVSNLTCTFS